MLESSTSNLSKQTSSTLSYMYIFLLGIRSSSTTGIFRHFQTKEIINGSGIEVDNAFLDLLLNIFPPDIWLKFRVCHPADYMEVLGRFEILKHLIPTNRDGYLNIEIPYSLLVILDREKQTSLEELVLKCKAESQYLKTIDGILKISVDRLYKMYEAVAYNIIEHAKAILHDGNVNRGSNVTLLMIGGFSKSDVLQSMVKKSFPDKQVLVPSRAEFCELKGSLRVDQNNIHKVRSHLT